MSHLDIKSSDIINEIISIREGENRITIDDFELLKMIKLEPRHHEVVRLRMMGLSYEKIGKQIMNTETKRIGICTDRARQMYRKALRQMRHPSKHWAIFKNEKLNKDLYGE